MLSVRTLLGVLGMVVVAAVIWSRWRHRGDAWEEELGEDREPVAVPVAVPRASEPVAVAVSASAAVPSAARDGSAFGPGSALPGPDGSGPAGWTIKAKDGSRLYHTAASPSWERMHADAWFESEAAAEAAGFKRWDWRRTRA
jgi:hypothetical protein